MTPGKLTDRELGLALAEALGWQLDADREGYWPYGTANFWQSRDWLLTPAGAFAVLDAMRELGHYYSITLERVGGSDLVDVELNHPEPEWYITGHGQHANLARAIAEAAYAALEEK
jgi:hypothetical protein